MATDIKPHQLTKQVGGTEVVTTVDSGGFLETVTATDGWTTVVQGIGTGAAMKRSYIDLAGWSAEELTTFVQGVDIQKMRTPIGETQPIVWEYDFLTTRKIRREEITFFPMVPGFLGGPSNLDLIQCVYGQSRQYAQNAQIPMTYVTVDTATFGTGDAVATDKLHWTRLVVFMNAGAGTLTIYPANLVISATTAREKDLVWMERLRRSFVLKGRVED
jgi:hypothetical protein